MQSGLWNCVGHRAPNEISDVQIIVRSQLESLPDYAAVGLATLKIAVTPRAKTEESFWPCLDVRTYWDGKLECRARSGIRGGPQAAAMSLNDTAPPLLGTTEFKKPQSKITCWIRRADMAFLQR
jgi:hypothetical protein